MSLPKAMREAKELYNSYKRWVRDNPGKVSDFELLFKWGSYFLAGRINKSMLPTETVFAASNLLVFLNDRIIKSGTEDTSGPANKLRTWLTTLEYCEVIIEIGVEKKWGTKMKWLIIAAMQTIKCALRLILLLKYKHRLVSSPAIMPLDRLPGQTAGIANGEAHRVGSVAFTLKKSGRVIRKVEASPSTSGRIWKPPVFHEEDESDDELEKTALTKHLTGEILYITKPLAQLISTYRYGQNSWRPWVLSFAMDVASLLLLKSSRRRALPKAERDEISRRSLLLVMYLLRSPFYDRHVEDRATAFLNALSRSLPLVGYIAQPVLQYIPYYHSTYSYAWST